MDEGNLGIKTAFIWAGFSVFLVIGAWFLVPDTTNLSTEEIDRLYTSGIKPRNFQQALNRGEAENVVEQSGVADKTDS